MFVAPQVADCSTGCRQLISWVAFLKDRFSCSANLFANSSKMVVWNRDSSELQGDQHSLISPCPLCHRLYADYPHLPVVCLLWLII